MKEFIRFTDQRNPIHDEIHSYGVTCGFSREKAVDAAELRNFIAELMTSVAESCFRSGAKEIGHVKAHLEHETGFLSADTLGVTGDVTVKGRDGTPAALFKLTVNSVVYGLAREVIRRATEESLESVSLRFGLTRGL